MNEDQVKEIVKKEVEKSIASFLYHLHNGTDAPQLDPNVALLGFPVRDATPTENAINGKIVLSDIGGVRQIWTRINNAWYSVTVT